MHINFYHALCKAFNFNLGLLHNSHGTLPTNEKTIIKTAPSCTALRLATFVILMVCTFSVKVDEPVPEPQSPAKILQNPSIPIPLLTILGVGGFELTSKDAV